MTITTSNICVQILSTGKTVKLQKNTFALRILILREEREREKEQMLLHLPSAKDKCLALFVCLVIYHFYSVLVDSYCLRANISGGLISIFTRDLYFYYKLLL